MQFRHFFVCLVSVMGLFAALPVNAQKVVTNQNGDKIIIYADGSWRYYEGEEELISDPTDGSVDGEKGKRAKKRKKRKKKRNKSQKNTSGLATSEVVDPEVEEEARRQAILYAERANAELSRLEDEQSQARLRKDELEGKLKVAQTDVNTSVEDLIVLEEEFKAAKAQEQKVNAEVKSARKTAKQAERMISMTKEKRDKYMARLNGEKIERIGPKKSGKKMKNKETVATEDRYADSFKEETGGWKMKKDDNVMLHPPSSPCKIVSEGVDEFTGRRRKELEAQLLFAYTRDELKPYLKERDYITCTGAVSAVSGAGKYLDLEFIIASDMAQREFGVLDKGSSIIIKFISGSTVRLSNTKTDIGILDKVNKRVIYKGQYTISGSQEKTLRKEEVDRIRVVWGTGYEDYEVYELDFFSDQLECLN